jgi:hypothetical protein
VEIRNRPPDHGKLKGDEYGSSRICVRCCAGRMACRNRPPAGQLLPPVAPRSAASMPGKDLRPGPGFHPRGKSPTRALSGAPVGDLPPWRGEDRPIARGRAGRLGDFPRNPGVKRPVPTDRARDWSLYHSRTSVPRPPSRRRPRIQCRTRACRSPAAPPPRRRTDAPTRRRRAGNGCGGVVSTCAPVACPPLRTQIRDEPEIREVVIVRLSVQKGAAILAGRAPEDPRNRQVFA